MCVISTEHTNIFVLVYQQRSQNWEGMMRKNPGLVEVNRVNTGHISALVHCTHQ